MNGRTLMLTVAALLLSACTNTVYVAVPVSQPDAEIAKNQEWLEDIEEGDTLVLHTHTGHSYRFTLEGKQFAADTAGVIPKDNPSMVEIHQMEGRKKMEPVISPDDPEVVEEEKGWQFPWWTPSVVTGTLALILLL
ncbi:hypothetical protein ACFSJ3_00450 [Corallincola platygyrae]|uniref:Uncharacterized protein n=1 Tax=Corallincola platygyrae TaxID=1193278 RepID=A0ABW4XG17_9GAMM